MPDTIDLGDFDSYILDSGEVDGKLYGVGLGENTITWLYDKVKLDELGIEPPRIDWTWEEFSVLAEEIYKRGGGNYWGSMDFNKPNTLEIWVRQRGKALYTADGQLGFDVEDVVDWFEFLDDLRQRGAIVPAEVQALDPGESITESMLSLGKACIISCSTNQLVAYQKAAPGGHELGMVMAPSGGPDSKPGQWAGPSQLLCITPSAANKLEAARFINFMVKSPDAANILGVERGVPPSASMREAVLPSLDEIEARTVHFMSAVADKVGALPPPPPQGATEIYPLLVRHNAAVGFGRATPSDAAKAFYADAERILSK
jgi:multiple sugar transport system substrate-binding protein